MTTTSVTTPAPATTRDLSLPTALGSALLAVGSLGYIASGTVMVGLADTMPDDASFLAGAASAWGMAFFAPKGVLLVAFPVLAAAGWRSGALPRAACLALVLAGLLSLWPPFPPAGALTALALYLVSRRAMPS